MDENKIDTTEPAAEGGDNAAPEVADGVDVVDSAALLASVTAERDQLARERSEYYDRLLRVSAEFDNFRKRAQRERSELLEYAAMDAVAALVPVLDDFERALKTESADKEYARGMELIYNRLFEVLKKLGLEPMEARGQKFDPNLHHAVEREFTDEVEDETVLEEHQRGYSFRGRLLRPAMVKVAMRRAD
jgi:molecular chaperone GrpE